MDLSNQSVAVVDSFAGVNACFVNDSFADKVYAVKVSKPIELIGNTCFAKVGKPIELASKASFAYKPILYQVLASSDKDLDLTKTLKLEKSATEVLLLKKTCFEEILLAEDSKEKKDKKKQVVEEFEEEAFVSKKK